MVLRILKFFRTFFAFILNMMVFLLKSIFTPRNIILIGLPLSEHKRSSFIGNARYFFTYIMKNLESLPSIEKVFLVIKDEKLYKTLKNKGLPVIQSFSIEGMFYHLIAKFHVITRNRTDLNSIFSTGSVRVNLWHGIPLKRIGYFYLKKPKFLNIRKFFFPGCWTDHYVLSPNLNFADIFAKSMGVSKENIIIANYPRIQALLDHKLLYHFLLDQEKSLLRKVINLKKQGFKIIGYFPTYRKNESLCKFLGISTHQDSLELLEFLKKQKIIILFHPHLHSAPNIPPILLKNQVVIKLESSIDSYIFLPLLDILITDYSSIYFDFLVLDKPIIFFPYDLETYKKEQGFMFDYDKMTPGDKVFSVKELIEAIESNLNNPTKFQEERTNLKIQLFPNAKEDGCKEILEQLLNIN